jgi:hypothetical protein
MTLEAFRSSLASGVTDVLQQVTFIQANAYLAPSGTASLQVSAELPKLAMLWGVAANLENIQPQASSFQPMPYPNFAPNNIGAGLENPPKVWDFTRAPKVLRPTEAFSIYASQTSGGAQNVTVFTMFTDGNIIAAPPVSQIPTQTGVGMFTIQHATATTTLTANAWTQVTPVMDSPGIPAGLYALVGMRAQSAGCLAFRVRPISGSGFRPGGTGTQTADQLEAPGQRFINALTGQQSPWGVWLYFYQNTPPFVEFWSTSADVKQDMWFDLIKISDATTSGAV